MRYEINYTNLEDIKAVFGERLVQQATKSATNKLTTFAKANISKLTRKQYNIKAKDIKESTAVQKKTKENILLISGKALPLKYFNPRQTRQGLTYKIRKDKGRQKLRHAFIVDRLGGNVFERKYTNKALPIKKLYTLSIPQMIEGQEQKI